MGWRRAVTAMIAAVLVGSALSVVGLALVGWRLIPVMSNSMTPQYAVGNVVLAEPVLAGKVVPGQVIIFSAPIEGRPLVMHRVVDVRADGPDVLVRTKGDANADPDAWTARIPADEQLRTPWRRLSGMGDTGRYLVDLGRGRTLPIAGILLVTLLALRTVWRPAAPADLPRPRSAEPEETVPADAGASKEAQ